MIEETRAKFLNLENVEVSGKALAGASGKLLGFPPDKSKVMLALPPEEAEMARKGMVDVVTLSGDSMEGIGLFDGDQVLCKTAFSKKDIKAKSVCIVFIHEQNDTFAKRVTFKDGNVILKSFNPNIPDKVYGPEEVTVQGIVTKLLLDQDPSGVFVRNPETKPISKSERQLRVAAAIKAHAKPEEPLPF